MTYGYDFKKRTDSQQSVNYVKPKQYLFNTTPETFLTIFSICVLIAIIYAWFI